MNPCALEEKQSMKCLDKNNYDRTKCDYFFQQYRECKKKWVNLGSFALVNCKLVCLPFV